MSERNSKTADRRVAIAADAYLNAEIAEARAQNALSREETPGAHREALAETAWEASRTRNAARDALMVALSTWRITNG